MGRTTTHRSLLFVPATNARALAKAPALPVDHFILDVEDAVGADDKPQARAAVVSVLQAAVFTPDRVLIRVNDLHSAHVAEDLRAVRRMHVHALLFPKIDSLADVLQAEAVMDALNGFGDTQIWVMLETAKGILNAPAIMAHPRVAGCVVGPNDLQIDLGTQKTPDRAALQMALQSVVLATRAAGKICIDGVYNQFRDTDGFATECAQGRMLGFDGKSLIHPAQIDAANTAFAASKAEIARAKQIVAAYAVSDLSVVNLDGEMIEQLHADAAQALLDQCKDEHTKG